MDISAERVLEEGWQGEVHLLCCKGMHETDFGSVKE